MKKLGKILLSIMLLMSLSACSSSDDSKEAKGSSKDETQEEKTEDVKATIEETVLYDANDIKITATSLDSGIFGGELNLLVENNSSQNIIVQNDYFVINDLMVDTLLSTNVASGKKANDTLDIYSTSLEISDITTISKMEFNFNIMDENFNTIDRTDMITLNTSATDYVQSYDTSGKQVISYNGINIYIKKVNTSDSFWGADIYLYIENNTDQNIEIYADDVSINGYMVDPYYASDVLAHKKCYDTMTFLESDLEDNNIEDITELEVTFRIEDENWNDIYNSGPITVEFE